MDRKITLLNRNGVALFYYGYEQQPIFFPAGGVNVVALTKIFDTLNIMFSYYSKVSVILFQFHQSDYASDNAQLSKLISKLKSELNKHYRNSRIAYVWAREQGKDGTDLHYHIAFMINGSLCNKSDVLFKRARKIVKEIHPENYIWLPKRCVYNLHRYAKPNELRAARMRMSYAAKNRTKEFIPKGAPKFGFSQLKRNAHRI